MDSEGGEVVEVEEGLVAVAEMGTGTGEGEEEMVVGLIRRDRFVPFFLSFLLDLSISFADTFSVFCTLAVDGSPQPSSSSSSSSSSSTFSTSKLILSLVCYRNFFLPLPRKVSTSSVSSSTTTSPKASSVFFSNRAAGEQHSSRLRLLVDLELRWLGEGSREGRRWRMGRRACGVEEVRIESEITVSRCSGRRGLRKEAN